jgi:cytidylate kinase
MNKDMTDKPMQIAIDGPAGAGKSTIAKLLAKEFGILYLDTGAMYRAVGLKALLAGKDPWDQEAVEALLPGTDIDITYENGQQHVWLDGDDVSGKVRTPEAGMVASAVAVIPAVRLKMVDLQQEIARQHPVVMDGRDIGTYVLPDAPYKFYLTASVAERARRRLLEHQKQGENVSLEEMAKEIEKRDKNDSGRAFAPLRQAEDAVLIDSTGKSIADVVAEIISYIRADAR